MFVERRNGRVGSKITRLHNLWNTREQRKRERNMMKMMAINKLGPKLKRQPFHGSPFSAGASIASSSLMDQSTIFFTTTCEVVVGLTVGNRSDWDTRKPLPIFL